MTMSSSGKPGSEQRKETPPEGNPSEAGPSTRSATGSNSSPAPAGGLSIRNSDANSEQPAPADNLKGASPADGKLMDGTNTGDVQTALAAQLATISVARSDVAQDVVGTYVVASPEAAAGVHALTTPQPMDTSQEQSEKPKSKEFLGFAARLQICTDALGDNSARKVEKAGPVSMRSKTPAENKAEKCKRQRAARKLLQQSESSASSLVKSPTAVSDESSKKVRSEACQKSDSCNREPLLW